MAIARRRCTVRTVLALLLLPGLAAAEGRPGTHFLLEANGGEALAGGRGPYALGLFGWGGRPGGLPLRLYLVAEVAFSASSADGVTALGVPFTDDRQRGDLEVGLRAYLPIWGPVRVFGDLLVGERHLSATLDRRGWPRLSEDHWGGTAAAAAGVQVRVLHDLSVGARAHFALDDEDPDDLRSILGSPAERPVYLTAGMTWHF
jgi:hypothetical protein